MISCMQFEQNESSTTRKCVDAVKRYLDKIKEIKSYRVNCHGEKDETVGVIAVLTIEMTPHEGKTVELRLKLWLEPVSLTLDTEDTNKKKRLTSRRSTLASQ